MSILWGLVAVVAIIFLSFLLHNLIDLETP